VSTEDGKTLVSTIARETDEHEKLAAGHAHQGRNDPDSEPGQVTCEIE
jgi:hypothetical protein